MTRATILATLPDIPEDVPEWMRSWMEGVQGMLNEEMSVTNPDDILTHSLGADVLLNNTANYFDGPVVAQGQEGTWFASGTVTVNDTALAVVRVKLWDGFTVIASAAVRVDAANAHRPVALSGVIVKPAGNIRISCRDITTVNGVMMFSQSANAKDSTLTAIRLK